MMFSSKIFLIWGCIPVSSYKEWCGSHGIKKAEVLVPLPPVIAVKRMINTVIC